MDKSRIFAKRRRMALFVVCLCSLGTLSGGRWPVHAQSPATANPTDSTLIADFRRVEVASVSDALEQLTGSACT